MVDVVNSVNINPVVKSKPIVGVVSPPDSTYKSGFYTDAEASRKFKQLSHELEHANQKVDYNDKKKTYKGLFVAAGIVAACLLIMQKNVVAKVKDTFKNFNFNSLKNPFKRKV